MKTPNWSIAGSFETAPKTAEEEPSITWLLPSTERRKKFLSDKCSFLNISVWESNLDNQHLEKAVQNMAVENSFSVSFELQTFPDGFVSQPKPENVVNSNSKFIRSGKQHSFISGSALLLILGTQCRECAEETAYDFSHSIIYRLRLMSGILAARRKLLHFSLDIGSGTMLTSLQHQLWPEQAAHGDEYAYLEFELSRKDMKKLQDNPAARVLHESSIFSDKPWQRLLYTWLAVEALIPGGKERMEYFSEIDPTGTVLQEVNRIRELRGGIAHEGKLRVRPVDCASAYWAMYLAALKDLDARKLYSIQYFNWIKLQSIYLDNG